MAPAGPSVWSKIDAALLPTADATDGAAEGSEARRGIRILRPLDILAAPLWAYALVKIFIFDFDDYLVARYAPALTPVLNLRFVVFVVAVAVGAHQL